MADILISYTSSDRDWAFWIAKELEALGHTPHLYQWEVKGGDDIYAWMEQRHDAADHVLCVMSDEYLKAPYSTLERNAALWHVVKKRRGFVLLVAVKPCSLPTLSDRTLARHCQLFGIPEDAARLRFREFMAKPVSPEASVFPGKVLALSNVPIRVPTHFMGRDDALTAIDAALKRYEGRVAITALHGLPGAGKTTLAATYAELHRANYRATWWIRAQAESTIRADLVALGIRLSWVAADEKEEPALEAVMERLRREGEGILLIFDNAIDADTLKPYLPRGGVAHVLVTSNEHAWRGVAEPVEIRLWPKEIGADYLIARTGRTAERSAAESLSQALGGLPLAHEQAAVYCERLEISLADYRKRFEASPARILDDPRHAPAEGPADPRLEHLSVPPGEHEDNDYAAGHRVKSSSDNVAAPLLANPTRSLDATSKERSSGQTEFSRESPEYWLQRVAAERRLSEGDQPLILISFASADQRWVDDLRTFLDPRIELLQDTNGQPYHLWNFSDSKRGTTPGDEFPETVAEKMWRCRAALIILSSNYFKSSYCRAIELPFLMWRRDHHKLMCLPLKLGTLPVDRVRLPSYQGPSRFVVINDLIDDRQAAINFSSSRHRNLSLKQLREEGIESEIENRFEGIARRVADFMKKEFAAVDVG